MIIPARKISTDQVTPIQMTYNIQISLKISFIVTPRLYHRAYQGVLAASCTPPEDWQTRPRCCGTLVLGNQHSPHVPGAPYDYRRKEGEPGYA